MKKFWTYQAPAPEIDPPVGVDMSREQWLQLTPGYRREITRQMNKETK